MRYRRKMILFTVLLLTLCNKSLAQNLKASATTGHYNLITWGIATQPPGEVVASTCLYKDGVKITPCLSPTTLSYVDPTSSGDTHSYFLTNVDTAGNEGSASNTVSATTPVGPAQTFAIVPTPTSLSFSAVAGTTPICKTMTVWANPATPLPMTLGTDQAWLTITPTSGTTKITPNPSVC